jgi:NAD(P)-dependent dehydrogenase (short-subunit alcohol dehydrogenase family)
MSRVCLVTGGTSGVGRAVAAGLAALGHEVVITARDAAAGEAAAAALAAATGNARVTSLPCDLADRASVREAAGAFQRRFDRLDVLAQVAGVLAWRRELTAEGIERVFAVNHVGHARLAAGLLGLLGRSGAGRIVTVTGVPWSLRKARLDLSDIVERRLAFSPVRVAVQAMLARLAWTLEAARRYRGLGITANAFFPGGIRSRLQRDLPLPMRLVAGLASPLLSTRCPAGVYACASPDLEGVTGRVIVGRRAVAVAHPDCGPEVAGALWELTEKLAGPL